MDRLNPLLRKYNVDHRRRTLAHDVVLTRYLDHAVLSCCDQLTAAEAVVGTAMMLGVLEFDFPGKVFAFRFPIPDDGPALRRKHQQARRDYRLAKKWAAHFLIPDRLIDDLRREQPELGDFCERERLTQELVLYRLNTLPGA